MGILGLLGVVPMVLIPAAMVVFGGTQIFSSGLSSRLNALEVEYNKRQSEFAREIARESGSAVSSIQVMTGLEVITLGLLALVGVAPTILSLVSGIGDRTLGDSIGNRGLRKAVGNSKKLRRKKGNQQYRRAK